MIAIAERAVLVTLLLSSALATRPSLAKDQAPVRTSLWTLAHDDDEGHVSLAVNIEQDPDDDFDEDYIIKVVIKHLGCDWTFERREGDYLHFSAPNSHKDFPTYDPYAD
jgi:hypothetical protein